MRELLAAIKIRFNSQPVAGRCSGLFYDTAPEGTAEPLVTFFIVSDVPDRTFGEKFHEVGVQFSIWGVASATEVTDIFDALTDAFDDCTLIINNYTCVSVDRGSSNLIEDPDGGWHYQVDYTIQIQEA